MYLDYCASHPLRTSCKSLIQSLIQEDLRNPSAIYKEGRHFKSLIDRARQTLADILHVSFENVIFTSGATEANNMMLKGFEGPVIVSALEHDSVFYVRDDAFICPILPSGIIDLEALEGLLKEQEHPFLVSISPAHHETGILQPYDALYALVKRYKGHLHADCSQIVGKIPFPQADAYSLSGHKMGGLMGCGALVTSVAYKPLMFGGGQEKSRRPGTENILGILTFEQALKEALSEDWSNVKRIETFLDNPCIVGSDQERLPHISLLLMPGIPSATQVMTFDLEGIEVSAGSACSSGKVKASRALEAMNIEHRACSLRVSIGATPIDFTPFCKVWNQLRHTSLESL